jgi:intracellular sulfur oxidation DsrE/DsrF family protein
MKRILSLCLLLCVCLLPVRVVAEARYVETPYKNMKVVFDIYLDDPAKLGTALHWIRSYMNPLMASPYNQAPEFLDVVVVVHGTEIVTLAKKNYARYKTVVDRMKYYASLGVRFRVCALAAKDYDYSRKDFQDFVVIVPSAMTELVYWQTRGYGLLRPLVMSKKFSIQDIR